MKLSKEERQQIFDKYGGKCAYCGCELTKGWHADHFEPIVRNWTDGTCEKPENNILSNMMPSCPSCNIMKSSLSIEHFRQQISQFVNSLNSYSTQYKFAKKYGLVRETAIEVKFYFETV